MLSSEQFKSRTKLERSLHKASLALSNFAENFDNSKRKYVLLKELRDRLVQCHISLTSLDDLKNDATLDEINRTLLSASSWLQSPAYRAPRKLKTDPRESASIPATGDGSGLRAFKFGTLESSDNERATRNMFENREQCENEPQRMTPISKKLFFADRTEAIRFKNTVFHFGLHFVIQHDYERYCLIRSDETSLSKSITVLTFYVFPMRSFKLSRHRLSLNQTSISKLSQVKSPTSASEFLDDFGSHVALDWNQLGGIVCQSIEIIASQVLPVGVFERYADEITSQSFIDLKFRPNGFSETLQNAEEHVELECQYQLETLGPAVAQPKLFERLLDASPHDLHTIDRDFSSLVGVWDIAEEQRPDLKAQADLLRRAWLDKAVTSYGFVVEREISKVNATLAGKSKKSVSSKKLITHQRSTHKERTTPVENQKIYSKSVQPGAQNSIRDPRSSFSETRRRKSSIVTVEIHDTPEERKGIDRTPEVSPIYTEIITPDFEQLSHKQGANSKKQDIIVQEAVGINEFKEKNSHSFKGETSLQPTANVEPSASNFMIKLEEVIKTEKIEPIYATIVKIPQSNPNQDSVTKPSSLPEGLECEPGPYLVQEAAYEQVARSVAIELGSPKSSSVNAFELPYSTETSSEHNNLVEEIQRINNLTSFPLIKKKYANYFMVDAPLDPTNPKLCMLVSIRQRSIPSFNCDKTDHRKSPKSYKLLLEILGELDSPSVRETLSLLIENSHLVPLFNPFTKESYLGLLKDIFVHLYLPKSTFINVGENKNLSRVAVISSREDTQAPKLIRSLFNVQIFHHEHSIAGQMAIDFGIGQLKSANQWVFISYIVGDYKRAIDFIQSFTDHLIVEDTLESETSVYQWVEQSWKDSEKNKRHTKSRSPFVEISHVTFWTLSESELRWVAPKDNFHVYGPNPLIVEAPLDDQLVNFMARILKLTLNHDIEERSFRPLSNRNSIRELPITSDLTPLNDVIDSEILNNYLNSVNIRQSLPLQRIFRQRYDEKRPYHADHEFYSRLDTELEHNVELSVNISLVDIFLKSLQVSSDPKRILILRLIEEALFVKTEQELALLSEQIKTLYNSYTKAFDSVKKPADTAFALKKYIEAKENYKRSALYVGHIWREISLAYSIKPYAFIHLPALAAQHMLDGFKLELLYNDSISHNWIHAILFELGRRIEQSKQRFFVVSCIGQQESRFKKSLLTSLFGLPKQNDGREHYTNGVCMQILPAISRKEYDYLLILDAEDTWPPTKYETLQALQDNYRIATLCSLIADATVIVNPKADELVDADILMKILADHEVTVSSKRSRNLSVFSLYNWNEGYAIAHSGKVRERAVTFYSQEESLQDSAPDCSHSLDITDHDGITCMSELRELIHQKVTEPREQVHWTCRSLSTIEKQLTDAWALARSLSLPLLYKDVAKK